MHTCKPTVGQTAERKQIGGNDKTDRDTSDSRATRATQAITLAVGRVKGAR